MNSDTQTLTIVQYNTNHSRNKVTLPFLSTVRPDTHHVLAIQEPWKTPGYNSTCGHPGYHTHFPDNPLSRVCFYISKNLAPKDWSITDHSPDLSTLTLQTGSVQMHIHNCYNQPSSTSSQQAGDVLTLLPSVLGQEGEHILLGDFNLHHPKWGGPNTFDQHKAADDLIAITQVYQLELLTPPGTVTWETPRSCQTLDLTFGSKWAQDRVRTCCVTEELESSSDHWPICTTLEAGTLTLAQPKLRPQWKKANWEKVRQESKEALEHVFITPLNTYTDLDNAAQTIQHALNRVIQKEIPEARPSQAATMQWTAACSELTKKARKARRQWKDSGSEEDYVAYRTMNNTKKRQIRKDTNICWRKTVAEITGDPKKVWKLAQWARQTAGKPPQPP